MVPRRSRPRSSFLWMVKPWGRVASAVLSAVSRSSGTAVRTLAAAPLGGTTGTSGT